ncbi:MAG: phosphatidate cytidylyltransferase [Ardenticatenaceae bacterium]|nr:phosphatidate cytidylyltransferase [Ardenticatenaceae bacterium]
MFRTRALVALLLTPVAALTIYFGGWLFFAVISLILLIGVHEYCSLMNANGWKIPIVFMMGGVFIVLLTTMEVPYLSAEFVTALFLFLSLIYAVISYERDGGGHKTAEWMTLIGGFVIFGWVGRHIILLRQLEDGLLWTFTFVAIIWMSDTMAYLVGSRIGRRQMTPKLSPKKSVEGYVSGIVLGTAGAALFKILFLPTVPWGGFFLLSFVLTPIIPAGDLGFSILKREAGQKDASQLIPGHGGILDRFDTMIWGSMIAYYLILYLL